MSGRWRVPVADVRLPAQAVAVIRDVYADGWLSQGPRVEAFEHAFADYIGVEHAVACSSATAALQLALAAAGVGQGDEVVMPALTFVACANAAVLAGALPVFADVSSLDDLTVDPDSVAERIGPRTRALVVMHYGGYPVRDELVALAHERGIPLIEDAAHSPGAASAAHGRCGGWGMAGCFSFFANKNLPLGEGGMLTTNDAEVAATARALRSHGMTSGTWDRYRAGGAGYDVERAGWNLRLDEPRAALGSELLPLVDDWNAARARAAARYRELLADLDGVSIPFAERDPASSAHHLFVVTLDPGVDRDRIAQALEADGIQTSVHYRPIHHFTAYESDLLPATDEAWPRLLTLPLFPHITDEQIEAVVSALERALRTEPQAAGARPPS